MTPVSSPIIIDQNPNGYRYSTEPFLLAHFVRPDASQRVLEVGTGCGVLALLLSLRAPDLKITAFEIQRSLYDRAVDNVLRNGLEDRIDVRHADFLEAARSLPPGGFDWIVGNPPYRKLNSGRLNPDPEKAVARHELKLSLPALVSAAAPLLKPQGRLALAYPPQRREEWVQALEAHGLAPVRSLTVYGHANAEPRILLLEAARTPSACPPDDRNLIMYNPDGSYTESMQAIYESFNYSGRSHRVRQK